MTRYRWVRSRRAEGYEVATACKVACVSRSAYYDFEKRFQAGPTGAEWDEAVAINAMFDIHGQDDSVGSPRMVDELRRRYAICVNHKRVERLMAINGIVAKDGRRPKVKTTIPDLSAPPLPDLVQRDFTPGEPGVKTCGDITYVPTGEGWLYVADVEDIGSRRIIGLAMEDHMRTELVTSAMEMAIETRGGNVEKMVLHADRGSQYLSRSFREFCDTHGIAQSAGRTGSCHDNAVAESFWATLKRELIHRYHFATRADAKRAITAWIHRYNTVRLHSTLGNVPPVEWELRYAQRQLKLAS